MVLHPPIGNLWDVPARLKELPHFNGGNVPGRFLKLLQKLCRIH